MYIHAKRGRLCNPYININMIDICLYALYATLYFGFEVSSALYMYWVSSLLGGFCVGNAGNECIVLFLGTWGRVGCLVRWGRLLWES